MSIGNTPPSTKKYSFFPALPGWFVERVASDGIPVINPKQFRSITKPVAGNILSGSMISRIVHQLEQKCRNVEPKANVGLAGSQGA